MSSFTLAWHFLIFGVLPYVVIAVLVLGSLARFVLAPYSWKSQSSEILDKKDIFWGANLFHIGVISSSADTASVCLRRPSGSTQPA